MSGPVFGPDPLQPGGIQDLRDHAVKLGGVPDPVNPPHYKDRGIEPIDAIEAWDLGFCLGNAVKYIARHQHKGTPLQDLRKALWYLEHEIANLERASVVE